MNRIDKDEQARMLEMAYEAMEHAYTPYSHFRVGACLRASNGNYYLGCNIENAAYGPTNCAERTAVFKAVYEGERDFDALAVVSSGQTPSFPCGVCRQVLNEFCSPDMPIVCACRNAEYVVRTLGELLPDSFGPQDLL